MGRSKADMYAQAQDYKKALQKKNDIEKPVLATSGQGSAVVVPSPETVAKQKLRQVVVDRERELVSLVLSGPVEVKRGDIPKRKGTPRRIYFDLSPAVLSAGVGLSKWVGTEGIIRLRLAQYDRTTVRVVAELNNEKPVGVASDGHGSFSVTFGFGTLEPEGHTHDELAKAKPLPDLKALSGGGPKKGRVTGFQKTDSRADGRRDPATKTKCDSLRRVVIDAGHGGKDPGAVGLKGTREKDLTLAIAKRIKAQMATELPGVEVVMTRESDKFLPLKSRTQIANQMEADIFISIHINASVNRRVRGVETYYLNVAHDRYAKRLSARENAMTENDISDLNLFWPTS